MRKYWKRMDQFLFTIKNIHGSESLSHLDPKKRNNLSTELKQESYLNLSNYGNLYTVLAGCVKLT